MRIRGVDHVEVTPVERAVGWRERKLRKLALCVDVRMGMAVASVEPTVGAGDGEPDKREQGKEHDLTIIWIPYLSPCGRRMSGRQARCLFDGPGQT